MNARTALTGAWQLFRRLPGQTLRFLFLQLVLRLIPLAPLLFLCSASTAPLALLCIPLWFLVVPPARSYAAEAMQQALRGGDLFTPGLVLGEGYGRKLLYGLKQCLLLLPWALPGIAMTVWLIRLYDSEGVAGVDDGFTLIGRVLSLGGDNQLLGIALAVLIYLLTWLPLCVGLELHSGQRHLNAAGGEKRRSRWGGMLRSGLAGLAWFVPFVLAAALLLAGMLLPLASANLRSLSFGAMKGWLLGLALAFLLLCLPAFPLKGMTSAAWAAGGDPSGKAAE